LSDGSAIGYDGLLLATGVRPRILPGIDGEGVCYLRTVTDATELRDRIRAAEHVAVLGGGFQQVSRRGQCLQSYEARTGRP
jgi:3-phenylpropionate/trans-cinnamate dioxygenase ferredoxin reductase component